MSDAIGDYDAATSRSSAKRICAVISKFNAVKRKLVTDIGFGGMLHMPQNNKVCRRFSVWLLRHIDISMKSIVISPNIVIPVTDKQMQRVLGIPCGEMKLVGLGNDPQEKADFIKFAIGSIGTDPSESSCLKVAEEVLNKEYGEHMDQKEIEQFKVSFVVFVTGHFLVAKSRINHGSDDYWGALLDTNLIGQYNFCSMVIDEIMESATRVQADLEANKIVKYVSGCSLGLQVLYVDSFNLGILHYGSPNLPRIALFDCETMNRMVKAIQAKHKASCYAEPCSGREVGTLAVHTHIKAEMVGGSTKNHSVCTSEESSNSMTKVTKSFVFKDSHLSLERSLSKPAVSTYLTAYLRAQEDKNLTYGQIDDLKWHNARMTLHVKETKSLLTTCHELCDPKGTLASIIEVHMEALMAKIFQDNLRLAQRLHMHQQDIVNTPCTVQTESGSTTRANSASYIGQTVESNGSKQCDISTGRGSNASSTNGAPKKARIVEGKRLFEDVVFSTVKRIKQESVEKVSVDKHRGEGIVDKDFLDTNVKKIVCKQGSFAKSPWMFGVVPDNQSEKPIQELHDWLLNNSSSNLQSYWIMHSNPRYIDLTGLDMKNIFVKGQPFSEDAFDIAIRRFNQIDLTLHGVGQNKCWRKILESDFASVVLSDEDPLLRVSVIDQFTGTSHLYDISECRMLIVPALLDNTWCSYFWDMQDRVVHVLDAHAYDNATSVMDDFHVLIIEKLQKALSKCIDTLFEGWSVDFQTFKRKYIEFTIPSAISVSEGILTMVVMRDFNGDKIVQNHNDVSLKVFEKMVMYEMMSIEGNYGKVPVGYVQSIDG